MPLYVLLSTLTDEGRKTVKERPGRILEVDKEIETLGAKVIAQYAVLGPYDFVNVVRAPDNKTIAKVSIELGSRGTVQIMSMPAIPVKDFVESRQEKVGSVFCLLELSFSFFSECWLRPRNSLRLFAFVSVVLFVQRVSSKS
jgi:uncharacterized protein with GYD domain